MARDRLSCDQLPLLGRVDRTTGRRRLPGLAVGTDNVLNVSGSSASVPVTIDNAAPSVTVTFPSNGSTYDSSSWTGSITGTASDPTNGITATTLAIEDTTTTKWWNGSAFSASSQVFDPAIGTTSWSYALAASHLTAGTATASRSGYRWRGQHRNQLRQRLHLRHRSRHHQRNEYQLHPRHGGELHGHHHGSAHPGAHQRQLRHSLESHCPPA